MSLTRTGVVSIATVAVVVPSEVVSVSVVSSFFLQAASVPARISAVARATTRVFVRIIGGFPLGFGNSELQAGMDQVRIGNLVGVGGVDFFPLARIAVEVLGDLAQTVARLDDITGSAARSRRGASARHVGKVGRASGAGRTTCGGSA